MFYKTAEGNIGQLLALSGKDGLKNEILTFVGLSMGGVLLALQAVIANKRAKAMEDAANEQAKANDNTEKGQRQERLKNAIEHLGHNSVSVRLGGAYELFHLAQDTEELNQRQSILDILCAHIRQTTSDSNYREMHNSDPSEEIQSLLNLMFRQDHKVFKGLHINLQGSWLNGANLKNARLQKAILSSAYLKGAWLLSARMQGSELIEAHMQGAKLDKAQMQGAKLWRAQFQGAYLRQAKLQGADLWESKFQGTELIGTQLHGAFSAPSGPLTFETRIRDRIDNESKLLGVNFEGGINEEDLNSLVDGLSSDDAAHLRAKLSRQGHENKNASHDLRERRGAKTGIYTEEEAEQWITEYQEAVSEPPKEDDS